MKRVLTLCVLIGLLAGSASAALFRVDVPTALQFTNTSVSAGDTHIPFISPTTNETTYGVPMAGQVGFYGALGDGSGDLQVIGTYAANGNAGLTGAYDGIRSFFPNDNNSNWGVQLFFVDAGGVEQNSGAFVTLAPGAQTYLTVAVAIPDASLIQNIGIRIFGDMTNVGGNPSNPDVYHVSLVPVPGAFLLGLLGLSAAGVRLRKRV